MTGVKSKIIYTLTDEAPLLATCAFLPIIRTFTGPAGIEIEKADISVSARVLSEFSEFLTDAQKVPNTLAELGKKCLLPETNIVKLPNISASVAQLVACVKELQAKGYAIPDYPEVANTDEEKALRVRFGKCLGSAVNPVLREGNSDRRAPAAVKNYARKNPHSMGKWSQASRTHVSHMHSGDFYHGEKSMTLDKARDVRMELIAKGGKTTVLKPKLSLLEGEIIDSMFMSKKALCAFYEEQLEDARESGVLFSLHVKATMMKVSHPIVFGHCVRIYYKEAFEKHAKLFDELGVNVNNGYINIKIGEPVVKLNEAKTALDVSIGITEGDQYRIGAIGFTGELLDPEAYLRTKLKSEPGSVFNRSILRTDIGVLTDVYGDKGYAFATINPQTRLDNEKKTVDMTFDVDKGELVTIERISIAGNPKTRDKVIRREVRVTEGGLYNSSGLKRSKQNLMNLGFFEEANVATAKGRNRPSTSRCERGTCMTQSFNDHRRTIRWPN